MAVSGKGYLQFGAGAAFLPRNTEKLRHSIQYGELHEDGVKIIPYQWAEKQLGWAIDSPDFYPIDCYKDGHWFFPFPSSSHSKPPKRSASLGQEWMIFGKDFVERREATAPLEADMLMFFDGRKPEYSFAFSSQIPVRKKTADYANEFLLAERNGKSKCMLLTGAGGEGKSTLSFQIIKQLALQDWVILHCAEPNKETALTLSSLEDTEAPVLVVVDDASIIAQKLYQFLRDARDHGKLVHLLMISDWASWSHLKSAWNWGAISDYSMNTIAGITLEEAESIIMAWSTYGKQGLGALENFEDLNAAAKKLYSAAQSVAHINNKDNSLLGAIIETRYGDEYLTHVRSILNRLQHIPLNLPGATDTLLDAFTRIALMHNEGKLILTSDILAELYQCSTQEVRQAILVPLRKEAITRNSGEVVCVRHNALVKCVINLMEEEFDYITWQDYLIEMVDAAMRFRTHSGQYVYELESWRYLANHFLNKGMKSFAVRIAEAVYRIEHGNLQTLSHLVNVYLHGSDPDYMLANQTLWEYPSPTFDEKILRIFARVANHTGQQELGTYLNCLSISDQAKCFTEFESISSQKIQKLASSIFNLPQGLTNYALSNMGRAFGKVAAIMDASTAAGQVDTDFIPLGTAERDAIESQLETGVAELLKILELDELPKIVPKDIKITFIHRLLSEV